MSDILPPPSNGLAIDAARNTLETAGGSAAEKLRITTSVGNEPARDLEVEAKLLRDGAHLGAHLFFFRWFKPVLVLGRSQSMAGIDAQICIRENIPVLNRHTGGSAVLHQHSLNISLVLDASHHWSRRIDNLYAQFICSVTPALASVGIDVAVPNVSSPVQTTASPICFESDSGETLLFNGRKVFGCAQRRLKSAVLVHGSLLLGLDVAQQSRVFNVPEDRIARAMTCIPNNTDERALMDAIVESFSSRLGLIPSNKGDYYGR